MPLTNIELHMKINTV